MKYILCKAGENTQQHKQNERKKYTYVNNLLNLVIVEVISPPHTT